MRSRIGILELDPETRVQVVFPLRAAVSAPEEPAKKVPRGRKGSKKASGAGLRVDGAIEDSAVRFAEGRFQSLCIRRDKCLSSRHRNRCWTLISINRCFMLVDRLTVSVGGRARALWTRGGDGLPGIWRGNL